MSPTWLKSTEGKRFLLHVDGKGNHFTVSCACVCACMCAHTFLFCFSCIQGWIETKSGALPGKDAEDP